LKGDQCMELVTMWLLPFVSDFTYLPVTAV